jgi:hypothetical protein
MYTVSCNRAYVVLLRSFQVGHNLMCRDILNHMLLCREVLNYMLACREKQECILGAMNYTGCIQNALKNSRVSSPHQSLEKVNINLPPQAILDLEPNSVMTSILLIFYVESLKTLSVYSSD